VPAIYPNRKCTCGFNRFRETRRPSNATVERWMLFDSEGSGGFGATPFGTYFGAGTAGSWGLFTGELMGARLVVTCENCNRVRSDKPLGGIAAFASYVDNGYLYVIASDITLASCFSIRVTGPGGVFESPLALLPIAPPPAIAPAPPVVEPMPPDGALLVDSLLRARLPEVEITGEYTVELLDRCCGCSTTLVTITLEAPAMVLSPLDADLGGAPPQWISGQGAASTAQLASGSRLSIPFDRCVAVHEYDARFGTLPVAQGWTHGGAGGSAGDAALVEGGSLQFQTTGESYFIRSTVVGVNVGRVYSYSRVRPVVDPAYVDPGDGFTFAARYATLIASPYSGLRYNQVFGSWRVTAMDGSTDALLSPNPVAQGWTQCAAADSATRSQAWVENRAGTISPDPWGTDGSAAALDVISVFGDTMGGGFDMLLSNFVTSFGGRFIRPFFNAFTSVTDPMVRLYLAADANGSALKTARFKLRYGVLTADPYLIPAGTSSLTLNFTTPNIVYEAAIGLTG
jgi:hypothetical protein